jgi:hypothetical protein
MSALITLQALMMKLLVKAKNKIYRGPHCRILTQFVGFFGSEMTTNN